MRLAVVFLFTLAATILNFQPANAGFRGYQGQTDLKVFDGIQCGASLMCSRLKNRMLIAVQGGLRARSAAVAGSTLTTANCGTTIYNTGAARVTLPLATNLGCRITFIVDNASNFDVSAAPADTLLGITASAGHAARSAVRGNTIAFEASGANAWSVVEVYGTFTDIP